MTIAILRRSEPCGNPLDILEELVGAYDWTYERFSDEELVVGCTGQWCDYALHFCWRDDSSAMQVTCTLDSRIPSRRRGAIYELLAVVNGKMWLGHFSIDNEQNVPVFRHTVLLRGQQGATVEQLEDLVDIAIAECERFYPAFQYVAWAGKSPEDAIDAALVETVGEA